MRRFLPSILFYSLFSFYSIISHGQERCGTVIYENQLRSKNPSRGTTEQFEHWMNQQQFQQKLNSSQERIMGATYNIPVVVHVLYNTTAQNISDAQIQSQIDVLNQDFNRLNADAVNTPSEFLPVAGSININFVLAKQDPDGLPTTGITRRNVTQSGFYFRTDDVKIKSNDYWPSENYLNIWVINFLDQFLGYAQYPVGSGLSAGLTGDEPSSPSTDGLVIKYTVFGTVDAGNFSLDSRWNKGRTTTHETGHFLGALRHIWGDDEFDEDKCAGTDYVADTPNQSISYNNVCPSGQQISCSKSNMYQNYMDYTNDACMNLFSQGQVSRMVTVLANSPRRVSLLTSPGLLPPSNLATDINLISIDSPSPVFCLTSTAPVIAVKNVGSDVVKSFKIISTINGKSTVQIISGLTLSSGEQRQFTLQNSNFTVGSNALSITVSEPNGFTDATPSNNTRSLNLVVNTSTDIIPLRQNFDGSYDKDWIIISQGKAKKWTSIASNKNLSLAFSAFADAVIGEESWLVSPTLNLSKNSKASLFFDVSYATHGSASDELKVLSSTDCGLTFSKAEYDKSGEELSGLISTSSWAPTTDKDWTREYINLTSLTGNDKTRFAFVFTNGNGNNLFLDNIEFFTDDNADPVKVDAPYSIYSSSSEFNITFNLSERQDVRLQIFNMIGQVVVDHQLPDILNQTYEGDLRLQTSGLYIVRMQIGNQFYSTKVLVNH